MLILPSFQHSFIEGFLIKTSISSGFPLHFPCCFFLSTHPFWMVIFRAQDSHLDQSHSEGSADHDVQQLVLNGTQNRFFLSQKKGKKNPRKRGYLWEFTQFTPRKRGNLWEVTQFTPRIHGHLNGENDRIRWGTLHFSWGKWWMMFFTMGWNFVPHIETSQFVYGERHFMKRSVRTTQRHLGFVCMIYWFWCPMGSIILTDFQIWGSWELPKVTRPGKRLQFANLKIAIEIVDLPIKNGDFP